MKVPTVLAALISCVCYRTVLGYSYPTYYMDTRCRQSLYVGFKDASRLKLTASFSYRSNWDCVLTVLPRVGQNLMAKFSSMDIESSAFCQRDRLTMYDGDSTSGSVLTGSNGLCGFSTPSRVYTTRTGALTLRFKSDSTLQYRGFTLILTEYSDRCNNGTSFRCRNSRCIDSDLTCDGWNNCGDNTDEIEGCGLSAGGIAGVVIGCFVVFVALLTVSIFLRRRRARYTVLLSRNTSPNYSVTKTTTYSPPAPGSYPTPSYSSTGQYQPQPLPPGAYPQ